MIYLNSASTSFPKPIQVKNAVIVQIDNPIVENNRSSASIQNEDIMVSCRKNLAKLFNADDYKRIIFTQNATESLNQVINGLDYTNKNHIITTSTEHNSVLRPLFGLANKKIIDLTIVQANEKGFVSPYDIQKAISKNTLAIIINHCSNVTGTLQNIEAVSNLTQENNIYFILDASQSVGVTDIDIQKLHVDFLAFTGHKSLFGLQGTGGFYISEKLELQPIKTGGTGIKSELLYQPEELPFFYESGTHNVHGIASLAAGVEYINTLGIETIKQKEQKLFELMFEELKKIDSVKIYGDVQNNSHSLISFNLKAAVAYDIGYILENSFDFVIRAGLHCAPLIHKNINSLPFGTIRISWNYLTPEDDILKFLDALKLICKFKDKFL